VKLADDVEPLLARARELATGLGHAEVAVEHVAMVFATTGPGLVALSRRRISRQDFVARLKARLHESRPVPGYRGAPAARAGLEPLLELASRSRALTKRLLEPLDAQAFAEWLLDGELAAVAGASLFDVAPVEEFVLGAYRESASLRQEFVCYEHALLRALRAPPLEDACRAAELDLLEMRRALVRALMMPGTRFAAIPELDVVLRAECTMANAYGRPVSLEHYLVNLLREPVIVAHLARMRIDAYDLVWALAHRHPRWTNEREGEGTRVRIFDDEHTTMSFVVDVLQSTFEFGAAEARETTLAFERSGRLELGPFHPNEARDRMARARVQARRALMPLRIELA
jgi:ATP-dependent Clp protease adapter protein ClpS